MFVLIKMIIIIQNNNNDNNNNNNYGYDNFFNFISRLKMSVHLGHVFVCFS